MSISILNTETANISSLERCLKKIGVNPILSSSIEECISNSNKVIIPGIGNMKFLKNFKQKVKQKIIDFIKFENNYLLGICLGAQVIMKYSEESEEKTLGLINGSCKKLNNLVNINLNVGYKKLILTRKNNLLMNKLFNNIPDNSKFYFLHKYYIENKDSEAFTIQTYVVDKKFDCLLLKNNVIAAQFHPELSKKPGEIFLENFSKL